MGIQELPEIIKEFGVKCSVEGAGIEQLIVGIDASIYLYQALLKVHSCDEFHCHPPIPVTSILETFDSLLEALERAGVADVVFVFDGASHPLKASTNEARKIARENAEQRLGELCTASEMALYDEVVKVKRQCVYPRADVVHELIKYLKRKKLKYLVAPFEADAQLASLCRDGVIDCVLTTDSDLFVLQVPILLLDLKLHAHNICHSTVIVVRFNEALPQVINTLLPELSTDYSGDLVQLLIECSVLLGCDYCDRIKGFGRKRIAKFVTEQWSHQDTKDAKRNTIQALADSLHCTRSGDVYVRDFFNAVNMFKYAPVFKFYAHNQEQQTDGDAATLRQTMALNALDDGIYEVDLQTLAPLGELELHTFIDLCGFEYLEWLLQSAPIGFDGELNDLYKFCFSGVYLLRFKRWFEECSLPVSVQHPFGSVIDFVKTPPEACSATRLSEWLRWRNVPVRQGDCHREVLVPLVRDKLHIYESFTIECNSDVDTTLIDTTVSERQQIQNTHYRNWETLHTNEALQWRDGAAAVENVRESQHVQLNGDYINSIVGKNRSGVRTRAMLRYKCGHFDLHTLCCCKAKAKMTDGSEYDVIVYKIVCTPSMRAKEYLVHLVFSTGIDSVFVHSPASRCECPAGSLLCSHMIGFLLQKQTLFSYGTSVALCLFPFEMRVMFRLR